MAKVEMDLSELDKIREALRSANVKLAESNEKLSKKDEEIATIKADKRIVKTTITHSIDDNMSSNWNDGITHPFGYARQNLYRSITNIVRNSIMRRDSYNGHQDMDIHQALSIFENEITGKKSFFDTKITEKTEYVNFEDVLAQIRTESEAKVGQELGTLRGTVAKLTDEITTIKANETLKVNQIQTDYNNKVLKIQNDYNDSIDKQNKKYNDLLKEFQDYKDNKDQRTLEQKVKDLEADLVRYKSKKWYQTIK